jgi:hypothetical protein
MHEHLPHSRTARTTSIALGSLLLAAGTVAAQGSQPAPGFTLFAPMADSNAYLLDENNVIVHTWTATEKPNLSVYLLPNGNLLRTAITPSLQTSVQEVAFDGTVVWDYQHTASEELLHHDVEQLPNGNVLMIVRYVRTETEAVAAGRDPATLGTGLIKPDKIIEVQKTGPTSGTIVWQWDAWDHLVQEFDPTQANYGVVADSPELIDINFPPGAAFNDDWLHINSVKYNPDLDQLCLSPRIFDELWVIDHSTTTAEAAGHTGGTSGKGGDLLYRWGNPQAYQAGTASDQQLFGQHDPHWIAPGYPGEGNILIFNNGAFRPAGQFSTVDEIVPPVDGAGNYSLTPGTAYGPTAPIWIYTDPVPLFFYSWAISGATRLPNGNTLVCAGIQGWLFEVDLQGNMVWQYTNQLPSPLTPAVFKVRRYEHYLFPSSETLSAATGGNVTYELVAGSANAGRTYVLLASASGTAPGTLVPGTALVVPLNYDALTAAVLGNLNTPAFQNFLGTLDATGNGTADLATGTLDASMVGTTVDFAFALLSPIDFASNPMPLSILP